MLKSQKHRTTLGKKKSKRFFVINNFDERMEMIRQKFGASSLSLSLSLCNERISIRGTIYIYMLWQTQSTSVGKRRGSCTRTMKFK